MVCCLQYPSFKVNSKSHYNSAKKQNISNSKLGISYILNVTLENERESNEQFVVKHVPLSDLGKFNFEEEFKNCFEFIEEAEAKQKKILVHCSHGKNRSACVVIAYLMKKNHWTLRKAWDTVKEKRPSISPAKKIFLQLLEFEKSLFPNSPPSVDVNKVKLNFLNFVEDI